MTDEIPDNENPYAAPTSNVVETDSVEDQEQSKEPFSMFTVFFACSFFAFLANGVVSFLPANTLPRLQLMDQLELSGEFQMWIHFILPGVLGVITYQYWYANHPESEKPDYAAVIVAIVAALFFG